MHAVMGARDLVGERLRAGGGRTGVGHFEHRGDPAHDRAQGAGFEILLVGRTGLAEVHLRIDHAREHMQPPTVDHLTGRSRRQVADRGNAPAGDGEIAHAFAVVVDDDSAPDDQIKAVGARKLSATAKLVVLATLALGTSEAPKLAEALGLAVWRVQQAQREADEVRP